MMKAKAAGSPANMKVSGDTQVRSVLMIVRRGTPLYIRNVYKRLISLEVGGIWVPTGL